MGGEGARPVDGDGGTARGPAGFARCGLSHGGVMLGLRIHPRSSPARGSTSHSHFHSAGRREPVLIRDMPGWFQDTLEVVEGCTWRVEGIPDSFEDSPMLFERDPVSHEWPPGSFVNDPSSFE